MMIRDYDYYREALRGRTMPLAFVDLDLFDENVRAIARRAGAKHLRIASKSIRCLPLMRRILASDPVYRGVMCYSAAEADWLAGRGEDDLLIAYPVVDERLLARIAARVRQGRTITLMIDCAEHVRRIDALARREGVTLPVTIDLDMSISFLGLHVGVRRSPVTGADRLAPVLDALDGARRLKLDGIMGYEAQVAGLQDSIPGRAAMNAFIRFLKRRSIREGAARRAEVVRMIRDRGHRLRIVNGGGTGSLETTRAEAVVTEVTAGSGFYSPTLFDGFGNFRHAPTAGFAIQITRRPTPDIFTCHGGGYIASGAAGPDKLPRPWLPEGAALLPHEGAGEVQTPIRYGGPNKLEIGDPVFMRHAKAGELCDHFDRLLLVSDGRVVDEAATYRASGETFL